MLSYEKIISINKDFADNHYVIKNFGNGERWQINDHDQDPTFKYPLMYIEDLPFPVGNKQFQYSLRVWFVTRVEAPEDRGLELLYSEYAKGKSDMVQCATDLVAFWVQDTNYPTLDIDKNVNIQTFIDRGEDKFTGCYVDVRFKEVFDYNNCIIPMDGVPAPEEEQVTITINSDSFTTVDCNTTYNVVVKDENGDVVGSKIGSEWIVPAAGGDPVGNTMNGVSLTDAVAGTTKNFTIRYADDSPVVVTTVSDSATAFIGEVPNAPSDIIYVRDFWQAGDQETATDGSLGWYKANTTIFDDNQPSSGLAVKLDPDDDTKLLTPNEWGNLNRVTNDKGGSNFADVGGGLTSDGATAGIMLDNYTGILMPVDSLHSGTQDWTDSVATAKAHTVTRYDGSTYNQWQMLTPKLVQHILTTDGDQSNIFTPHHNWSDLFHWIMGVTVGGTSCYFWRENQQWSATNLFQSFSKTSVNSGIDLIVWANKEDYV